jgi:cell wall-associated NlpC family hydrolase
MVASALDQSAGAAKRTRMRLCKQPDRERPFPRMLGRSPAMPTFAALRRASLPVLATLTTALGLMACGPSTEGPTTPPGPAPAVTASAPAVATTEPIATAQPAATATAVAPPTATPASASATASASPKGPSYVACGCGCCGGTTPRQECIYHSKGDDLAKIEASDRKSAKSPICRTAGCSLGTEYVYCD